jgi:aryl-alcohol dehydrogenase-like predicted oxidoreductase
VLARGRRLSCSNYGPRSLKLKQSRFEETLDALDTLVRVGKVRYLGASSMGAWQFSKAQYTAKEHGWQRFVAMQNHYDLIYREEEREMMPLCIDQGDRYDSLESPRARLS